MGASRRKQSGGTFRRLRRRLGALAVLLVCNGLFTTAAIWFVHHPRTWLDDKTASWPSWLTTSLLWTGNRFGDITDGLGLTGHDAVYEYDEEAPSGQVFFAGAPVRSGDIQPNDIQILDRGEFAVGWSPSLRHPVWCCYHVTRQALHPADRRPNFTRDRTVAGAPAPSDYEGSDYDRGHMVPNHAIESRYGRNEQKKTFLMSNIAPQRRWLNRGVWKDVEHRIADLWTARYGEIWVTVGAIPSASRETISGTNIDVPDRFYQVIVAQEGSDVRALAVVFDQNVPWDAWAARHIVTIDELEEMCGLDFLPDLPAFIQEPLEAELPTRLWPVRTRDIVRQILLRYD